LHFDEKLKFLLGLNCKAIEKVKVYCCCG